MIVQRAGEERQSACPSWVGRVVFSILLFGLVAALYGLESDWNQTMSSYSEVESFVSICPSNGQVRHKIVSAGYEPTQSEAREGFLFLLPCDVITR